MLVNKPGFKTYSTDVNLNSGQQKDDINVTLTPITTSVDDSKTSSAPNGFRLEQNYPNPLTKLSSTTRLTYEIDKSRSVSLKIFNLVGQQVRTLFQGNVQVGRHIVKWNGTDENGRALPNGVYLYKLTAAANTLTRRLILAR